MTPLEDRHRIAVARELTASAGVPLRDRYGFAAYCEQHLYGREIHDGVLVVRVLRPIGEPT